MVKTTREQRKSIYDLALRSQRSYKSVRRCVAPTFGCDGAVAVPLWGMWLLVEADGYVHS